MTFSQKRDVLAKFAELGAMTLDIDEFIDIVFLNFATEIENNLLAIVENTLPGQKHQAWQLLNTLIDNNELEHPVILALYKNTFINALIGPEYTVFDRYPEVYKELFQEIAVQYAPEVNIALIGCSYGQELISIRKALYACEAVKNNTLSFKIDVFNRATPIFDKLKTQMRYPRSVLNTYITPEQITEDFVKESATDYKFSSKFYETVNFYELDLLELQHHNIKQNEYNLVLIHNVIQYLEPDTKESLEQFRYKATQTFNLLTNMLKPNGILSFINESHQSNAIIEELQNELLEDTQHFHISTLKPAYLCQKITT